MPGLLHDSRRGLLVTADDDAIAHLEFTPTYECECNICPYHTICEGEAVTQVTVHDIGSCKSAEHGNRGGPTELLCSGCARARTNKAAQLVSASMDYSARAGGMKVLFCPSCGRGIRNMSDVIETKAI